MLCDGGLLRPCWGSLGSEPGGFGGNKIGSDGMSKGEGCGHVDFYYSGLLTTSTHMRLRRQEEGDGGWIEFENKGGMRELRIPKKNNGQAAALLSPNFDVLSSLQCDPRGNGAERVGGGMDGRIRCRCGLLDYYHRSRVAEVWRLE